MLTGDWNPAYCQTVRSWLHLVAKSGRKMRDHVDLEITLLAVSCVIQKPLITATLNRFRCISQS